VGDILSRENTPDEFADYGIVIGAMLNESHRGSVLLGTSLLEKYLKELLHRFMVPAETRQDDDDIFGKNGFLGTFSSRIKLSYRLGLISEDEYRDLEVIRRIRNTFAHELLNASFDNQSISSKCDNLTTARRIGEATGFGQGAVSKFQITVALLCSNIALRALHIQNERRSIAKPFTLVPLNGSE
jgi:DNA-binding MltR family transcriptional regulator